MPATALDILYVLTHLNQLYEVGNMICPVFKRGNQGTGRLIYVLQITCHVIFKAMFRKYIAIYV